MSLGFIPLVLTILLSEFTADDISIYIGLATGIICSIVYYYIRKIKAAHVILLSSTAVLAVFTIIAIAMGKEDEWPQHLLPLTIELTMIPPLLILFWNRKRYSTISHEDKRPEDLKEHVRITTLTLSCIRFFFGLVTVHFAFITIGLILTRSYENGLMWFMLHIGPIIVFILSIIIGQIEIGVLRGVELPEFVPVVNPKGEVIGKVDKHLAEEYKNTHTNPIIRIAIISQGKLFLSMRGDDKVMDKGKVDTPLETYLLFQEDINNGVERLLKETFPEDWDHLHPEFSIKYRFKNEETNRLVYLFILDLDTEDEILCGPQFTQGKLWTFQQIEQNLDQNYFSQMFENEYDHLQLIIETREIYKEF